MTNITLTVPQLSAPAQPLMLAAWSVTTPAYIRFSKAEYKDTPRSRWEAARIAPYRKGAA